MRKLWIAALLAAFSLSGQVRAQAPEQEASEQDSSENVRERGERDSNTDQDFQPGQNQQQTQNRQQNQVQGQIVEVDHLNRQVTIAPSQGQQVKVDVPEGTRITVDGVASPSLGLIREGQFVRASLGEGNSAQSLDVRVRQYSNDQ